MNNNEIKKLTVQQALEQGYTHYCVEDIFDTIESLIEYGRTDSYPDKKMLLLDKNKTAFNISPNDVQAMFEYHIENQDDFFCEDDSLFDELAEADFEKIAELINVGFKKRFMFPTEIELVTEDKEVYGG